MRAGVRRVSAASMAAVVLSAVAVTGLRGPDAGAVGTPAIVSDTAAVALVGQLLTDHYSTTGVGTTTGTITAVVYGPVTPPPGGCASILLYTYEAAPQDFATQKLPVDGTSSGTLVTSNPISAPGCYGWLVLLKLPTDDVAAVPTAPHAQTDVWQPALPGGTTGQPVVLVGQGATDTVSVSSDPGIGAIDPTLLGPVGEPASGCAAVAGATWLAAGSAAQPPVEVTRPTTSTVSYRTAAAHPVTAGCYAWTDRLVAATVTTATLPATAPGQQFLVSQATVTSQASATLAATGGAAIGNRVVPGGTAGLGTTLSSTLLGPVTPAAGGCATATWSGAPAVASIGPEPVTEGVAYSAPLSEVTGAGCYTWAVTLTVSGSAVAVLAPGTPSETLAVSAAGTTQQTTPGAAPATAGGTGGSSGHAGTGGAGSSPTSTTAPSVLSATSTTTSTTVPGSGGPGSGRSGTAGGRGRTEGRDASASGARPPGARTGGDGGLVALLSSIAGLVVLAAVVVWRRRTRAARDVDGQPQASR